MSETPRTDEVVERSIQNGQNLFEGGLADLARTLERALARRDALLREILNLLRVTDNFDALRLCKRIILLELELSHSASQGRKK